MTKNNLTDDPLYDIQVSSDQSTVWVHGPDGSCVGRFSKKFGLDIHTSITEQMQGASQCLNCTHRAATIDDWNIFVTDMMKYFKIPIDQNLVAWSKEEMAQHLSGANTKNQIAFKIVEMNSTFSHNLGDVIEVKAEPGESDRLTFSRAVNMLVEKRSHGYILSMDSTVYQISTVGSQFIKANVKIVTDEGSLTQANAFFSNANNVVGRNNYKMRA